MGDSEGKLPLKFELGAKASLGIRGEIPKASMGRLVDSLTDIIRPWTEKRGLRADQIRLQREDVAIEIAQKARRRLALEKIEPKALSTKLLIPFLERASLEDDDVPLRDAWASLLVSATKTEQARHLTFIDILSRISSQELRLIEEVCFAHKGFPDTQYPRGHAEENLNIVSENARRYLINAHLDGSEAPSPRDKFVAETNLTYGRLMHLSVQTRHGRVFFYFLGLAGAERFQSVEILQRERLVDIVMTYPYGAGGIEVGYFNVTSLGIAFVQDCSPQADAMAARRPPPVKLEPVIPSSGLS
jgi:hypothetical protein